MFSKITKKKFLTSSSPYETHIYKENLESIPEEHRIIDSDTAEHGNSDELIDLQLQSLSNIKLEFDNYINMEPLNNSSVINNNIPAGNAAVGNPPATNASMSNNVDYNSVFNSLRIPDAIKDLPTFDGNPRTLYDFISNVEEILTLVPSVDGTSYAKLFIRAIRNKIVGQANEVLNMYGTPVSWEHIKNNLIIHYSDKRNETSLIRDLHLLKQGSETVEKFYSKIIEILSTMTNHVKVHENNANVIVAKQTLHQEMCLNTFLSGLREPLGSTIRAMRPISLTEAFKYCLEEQNTHYIRNNQANKNPPIIKRPPPKLIYTGESHPNLTRNFNPPQYQRTNFPQTQYTTRSNTFNQQSNNQKYQTNTRPEPMDTSSGNSYLRRGNTSSRVHNFFKPSGPPNFVSEELFNLESNNKLKTSETSNENISKDQPQAYQSLDNWYCNSQTNFCEDDDENFRETASQAKPNT